MKYETVNIIDSDLKKNTRSVFVDGRTVGFVYHSSDEYVFRPTSGIVELSLRTLLYICDEINMLNTLEKN